MDKNNTPPHPRIHAIETRYAGCRFRSRVEARWAVFFNAIGVHWQYETEGFVLQDGTRYLPDFWLPKPGWWAEVKASEFSSEEIRKCDLLHHGTGHEVLILDGPPEWRSYFLTPIHIPLLNRKYCFPCDVVFIGSDHDHDPSAGQFFMGTGAEWPDHWTGREHLGGQREPGAYKAARSARFEHGESG